MDLVSSDIALSILSCKFEPISRSHFSRMVSIPIRKSETDLVDEKGHSLRLISGDVDR
jgi:hypothetical protein